MLWDTLTCKTRSAFDLAMSKRRSTSLESRRPRKSQPKVEPETMSEIRNSYVRNNLSCRSVAPMIIDLRGNAMSVQSTGHIHHPCHLSKPWKWARLVVLMIEADNLIQGLRGSAMSVHSTGHMHHPCHLSKPRKWARLVELMLDANNVIRGLRGNAMSVDSTGSLVTSQSLGNGHA